MHGTKVAQIRFWSKAGGLIGGGVPWVDAFILASASIGTEPGLRSAFDRVVERMRAGDAPSDAMADEEAFSDEIVRMVQAGEEMGDLETKCEHIARAIESGAFDVVAESSEPEPVDPLLDERIDGARTRGATHLHLQPHPDGGGVLRLRIDGTLTDGEALGPKAYAPLLDAVRRGATGNRPARHVDYREGPGAVVDLTAPGGEIETRPEDRSRVRSLLVDEGGLILIAGEPDAAFVAATRILVEGARKTCALTDRSLEVPGALHIEPGPDALRDAVAQDPDALVLPMIPDGRTARVACRIARGGRLVIAALDVEHAPDALAAFVTLSGDPRSAVDAVVGVLTPRTLPRPCPACRRPDDPDGDLDASSEDCEECGGSGIRGRRLAVDVLPMSEDLRRSLAAQC